MVLLTNQFIMQSVGLSKFHFDVHVKYVLVHVCARGIFKTVKWLLARLKPALD